MAKRKSNAPVFTCKTCGAFFSSYNPTPMFCSTTCRGISLRSDVDESEIARLYKSGMTQDEIADELATTRKVVVNVMRRNGVTARRAVPRPGVTREARHYRWGGTNIKYHGFHRRVHRLFGMPRCCDACQTRDETVWYDWANINGNYANPLDYERLCRSCHRRFDKWMREYKSMKR